MQQPIIYLDHNATTPLDPAVLEAMLPLMGAPVEADPPMLGQFGNAASRDHVMGWHAAAAVERAREQVASLLHADPREIVFTSGATEANNLAIKGVAHWYAERGRHIVSAVHEHKAVIDPLRKLEREGFAVTWLRPNRQGVIHAAQVAEAIRDDTILVSLMWANNELGSIHPIAEIGQVTRERNVLLHTDATQAVGKLPTDVDAASVDLLSASAHKLYGPKGVGCLFVRRKGPRVRLESQMDGGGHERGMRSGTLNVPAIVGFGAAADIAMGRMSEDAKHTQQLRDRLEQGITSQLSGVTINASGDDGSRMPNTSNMSFADVDAQSVMLSMRRVAVSAGAACANASQEPSYVLRAIGVSDDLAHGTLRFSVGRFNTPEAIDQAIDDVVQAVNRVRAIGFLALSDGRGQEGGDEGNDMTAIACALPASITDADTPREPHRAPRDAGEHVVGLGTAAPLPSHLSQPMLDYFDAARCVGTLDTGEANVVTGAAGSTECGDVLRLFLRLEPSAGLEARGGGRGITDARFQARGAPATIAAGSYLADWLIGRSLDDAAKLEVAEVIAALALPVGTHQAAKMAIGALTRALADATSPDTQASQASQKI